MHENVPIPATRGAALATQVDELNALYRLIADLLVARGIPMLFATGYGMAAVAERRNASVIDKPYTQEKLASALAHAMGMPKAVGPAA